MEKKTAATCVCGEDSVVFRNVEGIPGRTML
jgi:hypothetical protein